MPSRADKHANTMQAGTMATSLERIENSSLVPCSTCERSALVVQMWNRPTRTSTTIQALEAAGSRAEQEKTRRVEEALW